MRISRSLLFYAAWVAIGTECAAALYALRPWLIADSALYLELAKNLASGRYGSITDAGFEPDVIRPPGYPLLLCVELYVLQMPRVFVVAIQLALYCISIGLLSLQMPRGSRSSVLFLCLCAMYPFAMIYSTYLATEGVTIALTTFAVVALLTRSPSGYCLCGAFAGIAALMRSDMLLLPFACGVAVAKVEYDLGKSKLQITLRAACPVVISALFLMPYAFWNQEHFGKLSPVPLAGAVGPSLYLSTWQEQLPLDDLNKLYFGVVTPKVAQSGMAAELSRTNQSIGAQPFTAPFNPSTYPNNKLRLRMTGAFERVGIKRVEDNPGSYALHVIKNVWRLWNTAVYPAATPRIAAFILTAISYFVFLSGSAGALMAFLNRPDFQRWQPAALVLPYPIAIHMWLHTEARYTACTRLLLVMFAALFISWVWNALPLRRNRNRASEQVPSDPDWIASLRSQ